MDFDGPYLKFYYDYKGDFGDLRDSSEYWPAVMEKVTKNVGAVPEGISKKSNVFCESILTLQKGD